MSPSNSDAKGNVNPSVTHHGEIQGGIVALGTWNQEDAAKIASALYYEASKDPLIKED